MAEKRDFVNTPVSEWNRVFQLYDKVLKAKCAKKTKPGAGKELMQLDKWFQTTLSENIRSRKEQHIQHEELAELMKWKLSRGKFRPRLSEMVKTNKPEDVEAASKKAFKKLPNMESAIKALTVLKAVGPATASAVLAAGAPEHAPFMADEAMLSLPGLQPLDYTLSHYLRFNDQVQQICARLKKEDKSWTPHKVELTLWTHHLAKQLNVDDSEDEKDTRKTKERTKGKRLSSSNNNEGETKRKKK